MVGGGVCRTLQTTTGEQPHISPPSSSRQLAYNFINKIVFSPGVRTERTDAMHSILRRRYVSWVPMTLGVVASFWVSHASEEVSLGRIRPLNSMKQNVQFIEHHHHNHSISEWGMSNSNPTAGCCCCCFTVYAD